MQETSTAKDYFKKCFNKNLLITKGIIAACALVVVLAFSLSFYFWLHNKPEGIVGHENKFWFIDVKWNEGIGFSALSGNTSAIYAIQSIMFILLLAIFIFLTHDKISSSFVALAMFGGFFNLIQRAAESGEFAGCVLDYFHFGFWKSFAIFNWPDMFVVIGIFGFVISYIIMTVIQYQREKQQESHKSQGNNEQH